jgi:O-antigen/teichoic acid export membrane protein
MTDRDNTQVQLGRPSDPPTDGKLGVHEALGARLSRDTSIYVIGSVILFVLAFISVIVTTRFLTPPEFGELALLMVFAAFLTIAYNTGIVQGTLVWVFGAAGEEDVDDVAGESAAAGTKRHALGTGLMTTLGITVIGTAVMVALSPWLAELMLGNSDRSELIIWAAVSGAAGAMWRMVSNILRMERKPRKYVVLNSVRPVLVVGITTPLIASGGGVKGAILGTAIASCLSVAVGLLVTRQSYVIALDTKHLRMILGQGAPYIPIVLSIWIVQNLDLYAVSWWTNNDQVGLYRLANRYGAFLDYFTAALFMAWAPLRATSTFQAATAQRRFEALGGSLLTYFVLAGLLLILLMTVAADTLVRVAPPAYAAAAPLIPLMGASFLSYGLFVAIYRLSSFPWKRAAYSGATMASAAFFLPAAAVLVPWLGASGAALSVVASFLFGTAVMTYLSQRGANALEIEYRRIATALLLAAVCIALARGVSPLAGSWAPAVEILAFVLFPAGLLVLGVVSSDDRRAIGRVVREVLPRRSHPPEIEDRVRSLRPDAALALEMVAVERSSAAKVADRLGAQVGETEVRLVHLLRDVGKTSPTDKDSLIADYLFGDRPVAERDAFADTLWSDGVDPADLHHLERTLEQLRRVSKRTWKEAMASSTSK